MPTENYYNQPTAMPSETKTKSPNFVNRMQGRYISELEKAEKNYQNLPAEEQQRIQNKLNRLQKNNLQVPKNIASATSSMPKIISSALGILKQIDLEKDWMFLIMLAPLAFLKDIFDIAFAAAGTATSLIPVLGQATVAVGMIVTFVGEILLLILTVTVLVLTGSSLKNRGMAKYFIGLSVAFISEALPGIGWLPLAVIEVFILYGFVLYDRAFQEPMEQIENKSVPA